LQAITHHLCLCLLRPWLSCQNWTFEPLKALPLSDQPRRYHHLSRWTDADEIVLIKKADVRKRSGVWL
jgi:hypothetical protein